MMNTFVDQKLGKCWGVLWCHSRNDTDDSFGFNLIYSVDLAITYSIPVENDGLWQKVILPAVLLKCLSEVSSNRVCKFLALVEYDGC